MREIILNIHGHTNDLFSFSTQDFHLTTFIGSFEHLRNYIATMESRYGYEAITWYNSYPTVFMVGVSFKDVDVEAMKVTTSLFYNEEHYAELLSKEAFDIEDENRKKKREEEGYAVFNDIPHCLKELQGNLPLEIVMDNLDYLSTGCVFGYFGSYSRMLKHDDWIKELYENSTDSTLKNEISQFLNHSSARHFMDSVYKNMEKEEFISRLLKGIERVREDK